MSSYKFGQTLVFSQQCVFVLCIWRWMVFCEIEITEIWEIERIHKLINCYG